MVDKKYCMSSFLTFRYIVDDEKQFSKKIKHQIYTLIPDEKRILVNDEIDVDVELEKQFKAINNKKIGILLSGGMDSACLASYLQGCDAYTFRFLGGKYQEDELKRAEYFAKKYNLKLHYVDICWETVENNLDKIMLHKGAPVHSIEPQVYQAALQAKNDGVELMVIGDAADYVFGGMDGLHAKDWSFDEFVQRCTYVFPEDVLNDSVSMQEAFEKYREGNNIDFISLMHEYVDIESYASYKNAFDTAKMDYIDPYEILKMKNQLDLNKIRNGESKYIIRALFRNKYPEMDIPQKNPMPRPVDEYFSNWNGPQRHEFKKNLDVKKYSGNQKWLIWCLERFLNLIEKLDIQ